LYHLSGTAYLNSWTRNNGKAAISFILSFSPYLLQAVKPGKRPLRFRQLDIKSTEEFLAKEGNGLEAAASILEQLVWGCKTGPIVIQRDVLAG
jgi:hypothetical protein